MADDEARRASRSERDAVVAMIARAFESDPLVRWFFPDDATYPARAREFFGYLFDIRVEHGEVYVVEGGTAASLWTPPGASTMPQAERQRRWTDAVEAGAGPGELDRLAAFGEAVDTMVPPEPYWYLGVLGTDPAARRRGLARSVLLPMLERADDDELPVFLETGSVETLPFYARFGFAELARREVRGGPTVWGLQRLPSTP